jgi:hypothetical protein
MRSCKTPKRMGQNEQVGKGWLSKMGRGTDGSDNSRRSEDDLGGTGHQLTLIRISRATVV